MAISDIIEDIAPEFSNEDPARIDRFIGYAELQVSSDAFGTKHDLAVANLTAHMLSLSGRNDAEGTNGTPGVITQKKEGDLSLSFGMPGNITSGTDGTLAMTSYGLEYLRLRDMCIITPRVFNGY